MSDKEINWIDAQVVSQYPPNPDYPNGIDIDVTKGNEKSCTVLLPYPAKRIGAYHIYCKTCGLNAGVTTAGRIDDPKSVKLACQETLQ